MNTSTRKIWLVIFGLLLLNSLFPPRLYVDSRLSAGRALVLWPTFYQADRMTWHPSMDGTPRQTAFHERKEKSLGGTSSTAWNPAMFDFGTYIAESIFFLSLGAVISIYGNLKCAKKETEQDVALDS